jgi:hypothetical protein
MTSSQIGMVGGSSPIFAMRSGEVHHARAARAIQSMSSQPPRSIVASTTCHSSNTAILDKARWLLSTLGVVGTVTTTASGSQYVHDGLYLRGGLVLGQGWLWGDSKDGRSSLPLRAHGVMAGALVLLGGTVRSGASVARSMGRQWFSTRGASVHGRGTFYFMEESGSERWIATISSTPTSEQRSRRSLADVVAQPNGEGGGGEVAFVSKRALVAGLRSGRPEAIRVFYDHCRSGRKDATPGCEFALGM